MSSFSPSPEFRWPLSRWVGWRTPVLVAAQLLLVEALLHVPAVRNHFIKPSPYYNVGVYTHEEALARLGRAPDVLFVGSSIVRTNIDPGLIDKIVRQGPLKSFTSFNGGLSGLGPDETALFVDRFWLKRTKPRCIVQGVREDDLFNVRTASESETLSGGRYEQMWLRPGPFTPVNAWLTDHVRLYYYYGCASRALAELRDPILGGGFAIDAKGFGPTRELLKDLRVSQPALIAADVPYARTPTDTNTRVFQEALLKEKASCAAQHVQFAVINVPEHAQRWTSDAAYQAYLKFVAGFCAKNHISFVDPTNGDRQAFADDALFSDLHHMSPAGAAKFSRMLANVVGRVFDAGL